MSKTLSFEYDGTKYELEFTKKTIREMERSGFVINDIGIRPMTVLPQLFEGAFLAHHRKTKLDTIREIYKKMPNKEDLIGALSEMYNDPIQQLLEEPEDSEGNVTWTASF